MSTFHLLRCVLYLRFKVADRICGVTVCIAFSRIMYSHICARIHSSYEDIRHVRADKNNAPAFGLVHIYMLCDNTIFIYDIHIWCETARELSIICMSYVVHISWYEFLCWLYTKHKSHILWTACAVCLLIHYLCAYTGTAKLFCVGVMMYAQTVGTQNTAHMWMDRVPAWNWYSCGR